MSLVPESSVLLQSFQELSRRLIGVRSRAEIVQMFSDAFDQLFPGRSIAIRLVDPETAEFQTAYANGRLRPDLRDRLLVTRICASHCSRDCLGVEHLVDSGRLEITDRYQPIFEGTAAGFTRILCDSSKLYGLLNVEYEDHVIEEDQQLIAPFVYTMCAAVRSAQLVERTIALKNRTETLFDRANAPMFVLDAHRNIQSVNQSFERISGRRRSEILGVDFLTLLADDEKNRILPAVLRSLRGEDVSSVEVRITHRDENRQVHLAFNTATVSLAGGEIGGVIWVGQDLTEVLALKQQVIHSEKLATLGQVAAGVAHELNNPLTSISVYGAFLVSRLKDKIDASEFEKLERIVEAASRIQSFSKDLVAYGRPSGDKPQLVFIDELFNRSLSFCEHVIANAEAEVSTTVEPGLPPVMGILGQLEQVVVNLITNACHALSSDGGSITLSARSLDVRQMEIVVANTGDTIAQGDLENIFEPFFTTKKEGRGTGLGLSIVRNILLNHDATIVAQSQPDKETRFVINMYKRQR